MPKPALDADTILNRATPVTGDKRTRNIIGLLFDKHYDEQNEMVDAIAERIQLLGGVSVAMAHDVAETLIPRAPKGREEVPAQISCLPHAHEIVLKEARAMARRAAEAGDAARTI
jgi:starvation-inducible DNA-binding protein